MEISTESSALDLLTNELKIAHEKGLIPYYHLGRFQCPTDNMLYIDVYICLSFSEYDKAEKLRGYLRQKYGSILRAIAVEVY